VCGAGSGSAPQERRDILIASHDVELLKALCEEVWWVKDGRLAAKGDPKEVIDAWLRHSPSGTGNWARA